ncbi:MAG: ABC transporter substrate-binding protein, partial [Phyllobacterium sp.]
MVMRSAAGERIFAILVAGLFSLALGPIAPDARAEILLKDAMGRQVRLAKPATRIVTNESLILLSLALLDRDPVARLAGWATPQRFDRGMYAAFRRTFPAIDDIPVVGAVMPDKTSAESILSVSPDLFVVSLWQSGWEQTAELLQAAGVPVIFLDGADSRTNGPAGATTRALDLLGKAIGREDRAREVTAFIDQRYRFIAGRLAHQAGRPDVLVDAHAGALCCATPGAGNRLTQIVELAGGHSIGADLPGYDGQLNVEYVLKSDPDVYIGTGGPHLAAQGGLVVGGGIDAAAARASLADVTRRNFLDKLTAIRAGNG